MLPVGDKDEVAYPGHQQAASSVFIPQAVNTV